MSQCSVVVKQLNDLITLLKNLNGPQYKSKAHQYQTEGALAGLRQFLKDGDERVFKGVFNRFERLVRSLPSHQKQQVLPIIHDLGHTLPALSAEDRIAVLEGLEQLDTSKEKQSKPLSSPESDSENTIAPVTLLPNATVATVCQILHRVSAGLRRWTWETKPRTRRGKVARMWHIENEYHVQSLLWLILAPIFPDLIDEEYTAGVGHLHPRADICIPSLRVIVEAKFMRAKTPAQKMIAELAADSGLYLARNSLYEGIIPFIWDDAARPEQHDYMIQGMKSMKGVLDVIIVARPGVMKTTSANSFDTEG